MKFDRASATFIASRFSTEVKFKGGRLYQSMIHYKHLAFARKQSMQAFTRLKGQLYMRPRPKMTRCMQLGYNYILLKLFNAWFQAMNE